MKTPIMLLALVVWQFTGDIAVSGDDAAKWSALSGTVSDPEGKPLAGVRVDISMAAPKVGRGIFCPSCYLDCAKWVTTDEVGEFQLKKLDPKLKFRLLIAAPGRKTVQTKLVDPQAGPVQITLPPAPANVDRSRVVSGVITLSGVPVAGALVEPTGGKSSARRWYGRVDGVDPEVTDESGRFAMVLPKGMLALDIEVTGYGFCGRKIPLLEPGGEAVGIEVNSGARVTGKVVRFGQPVAGMSLGVVQTDRGVSNGIFIAAVGDVTDTEGRFEFRYLPPDQQYCIYSVVGDARRTDSDLILTTKLFTVPSAGQTRDLGALEASKPISIQGRVHRVDGKPLPQNLRLSFGREPAWDLIGIPVKQDGSFAATGLPPETYEIRIGDRSLVVVSDNFRYQMLGASSFGVNARESIDNLVIPVKGQ